MTRMLEKMIANYPKPEYWQGVLSSMLASSDFSDRNRLQLFRLATEVDVLKRGDDYTEMAQLAQEQGAYAEAERILKKGFEKKVFTDQRSIDKNNRLLASVQKGMAQDKASLPQRAQAAAASPNGDDDVIVGIAYLSYEQFPEAIKVLQNSLTKPMTDPKPRTANEIKLLIGVAQLEAGDKQSAVKTFREVKNDPQLERLASLWSLRARQT
jgi:tetratricopeptide (TPR) repeat protein